MLMRIWSTRHLSSSLKTWSCRLAEPLDGATVRLVSAERDGYFDGKVTAGVKMVLAESVFCGGEKLIFKLKMASLGSFYSISLHVAGLSGIDRQRGFSGL